MIEYDRFAGFDVGGDSTIRDREIVEIPPFGRMYGLDPGS